MAVSEFSLKAHMYQFPRMHSENLAILVNSPGGHGILVLCRLAKFGQLN